MAVAEKAPSAEAAVAAPAKKGPPVVVLIAVTALVAFAIGFMVMKKSAKPVASGPAPIVIGESVPLDEFLINLADTDSSHYLKVTIALGLVTGKTADEFKTKVPLTRDTIVMILSSKTLSQVTTTDGKEALKKQLMDSLNKALGDNTVGAVYFQAFATQ